MTVALWTICRFSPGYELFGTEAAAASRAVVMDRDDLGDHGVVMGVQYEDGRTLRPEDWPAYREEEARREAEDRARAAAYTSSPRGPAPPRRTIRDPFAGFEMDIDAAEPGWLGQPGA